MTSDLDLYKSSKQWYDRVRIISLYHYGQIASHKSWLIKNTAEYFGVSISTVAEDLQIAGKFKELKDIGSRNKALKKIRGIKI